MLIFFVDRNFYFYEVKFFVWYLLVIFMIIYFLVEVGFELLGGFGYGVIVSIYIFLNEFRVNLDVDECCYRYVDFSKNIFWIFYIDLGNG